MKDIPEYPLRWPQGWPRTESRKVGQFKSGKGDITYFAAEQRLLEELKRLCKQKIAPIVSSNMLRTQQPKDAGVAVYFQEDGKPMRVIAVDVYTRVEDNIAAIAATIEAMRAIERHGGAEILERAFTGFNALPPPKSWWQILGCQRGAGEAEIKSLYRQLAKIHHPDSGVRADAVRMAEINQAYDQAKKDVGFK